MMKEEYFQHPSCAYLGKLANIPLTIDPIDLRQYFEDEVRDRFHEAQIIKIEVSKCLYEHKYLLTFYMFAGEII